MSVLSANIPCNGGIKAPPRIIIIKKPEAWLVYFPNPAVANEKMQGHMIEQNKPPLKNEYTLIWPMVIKPINIATVPRIPKIIRVKAGFCCPKKKAATNMATQMA